MIQFLKKYKAFLYGLILFRLVVFVLSYFNLIYIDNSEILANSLSFVFGWLIFSLPIYYFSFLIKHRSITLKLALLIGVFFAIIVNDVGSDIDDNPITFIGLVGVGLTFFSMIMPSYFKKNVLNILGFYTVTLGFFLYLRVYSDDMSLYFQQEKEIKIILITPFFLLFLGWVFQQWKWLKTVESRNSKAELALLKSQINPHFFFNTLNNLYGLTVEKSDDAPDVVLKLSEMMRYTIYMGKEDLVPLKDEIEYLENYIELHKIRYHQNVDISFTHSQSIEGEIAPLLFIVPLENAFKHGVERLTNGAYVHMDLQVDDGRVHMQIENNFKAFDGMKTAGIGLDNLEQRLKLLYPSKHRLMISQSKNVYKRLLYVY